MLCSELHPLNLFSLVPINEEAKEVLKHPFNKCRLSTTANGLQALEIGFRFRSQSDTSLATLGRKQTDIIVPGSCISKLQCSFEIDDPDTGVVMLYDRSHGQTTQTFGEDAKPFEPGRIRRIVVTRDVNTRFGMGGIGCDFVQFELRWPENNADVLKIQESARYNQEADPQSARTLDEALTIPPSLRTTRVHIPGFQQLTIRYVEGSLLGSGQFGEVYRAIDIDSGKIMAVKMIKQPQSGWKADSWQKMEREVEILAMVSHPNIVDFIGSQGWAGPRVEIFMGLKDGSLEGMLHNGLFQVDFPRVAQSVFHQMLQALDCLASKEILHRDVKPENILYKVLPTGGYIFQLTDFGLCNLATNAKSYAGSPMFMAPEVSLVPGTRQTSKIDCWSLFVTMAYAINAGGYRSKQSSNAKEWVEAALAAAETPDLEHIKEMAVVEPEKRASAAQMLIKHYNGDGLSTPHGEVPALIQSDVPVLEVPALIQSDVPVLEVPALIQSGVPVLARRAGHQTARTRNKPKTPLTSTSQDRVQKRSGPRNASQGFMRNSQRRQMSINHIHVHSRSGARE